MNTNTTLAKQQDHVLFKPNALESAKEDIFKAVSASVARSYVDLNYRMPDDDDTLNYMVNEITEIILNRFPQLRMAEIPKAFSNGIRHRYGEFFGLSVITFETFIEKYLDSPERMQLVEEKHRLMIEEKTEPTADEKFNMAKSIAVEAYQLIINGRSITMTASTVYAFLHETLGLITEEHKKGMLRAALEELPAELEREVALSTDIHKRRKLNADIEMLRDNIKKDQLTKDQSADVIRLAKRLTLEAYLRDIAMDGIDLDELVESMRDDYKQANTR